MDISSTYIDELKSLLSEFLGEPSGDSDATWVQYNCPCCAAEKGVAADNKYNLEVSLENNAYHCWVCGDTMGTKGKLGKLVRQYGGYQTYRRFLNIIDEMRQSELYNPDRLGVLQSGVSLIDDYEPQLSLPPGFKKLSHDDVLAVDAYNYLYSRGLNDQIIEDYNIGYVGKCDNIRYRDRIIIPSYNSIDELNYWIGRTYDTSRKKFKYNNPDVPKTFFVFNEGRINWYENITLVEGVFDHIVTPNSIPLLGKTLSMDDAVYKILTTRAMANINIMLDGDARADAINIYKLLEMSPLQGRVKFVPLNLTNEDKDASDIYQHYGPKGIINLLRTAHRLNEFDLL